MLNGWIVADATAHGYNWDPQNFALEQARAITNASWGLHQGISAGHPDLVLTESEFKQNWQSPDIADTLFFEAGIDLICHHGTPIWDFFKDGHADTEKGFELRDAYPGRAMAYGAMNPWAFDDAQAIRDEVDRLVDRGASGLKLYAARYHNGATLPNRMDDETYAYPMIERAIERGVKVIASHKALPIGPVHYEPYGVSDFPLACARYPEMNFEVVHAGMAFIEETCFLARTMPNCWFNLETSFAIQVKQPRRFAEFLGELLRSGAGDRIVYASGFSLFHPSLALRAFVDFEMPEDLVAGFGYPQVTAEMKEKILGLNYLRLHGIDPQQFRESISRDNVAERQATGWETPWSNMRARAAVA
jgi:uncharacterized protein